jgi:predicted ATPase/class 3 adenylate cyclase
MICGSCGLNNSSHAISCANCGTALNPHCPACAAAFQPGARFCSNCGHSLAAHPDRAGNLKPEPAKTLAGERRQVSILFADFCGFTSFSEQLDPEDVRETMNSIWTNLDAIITHHGGFPEKHSGDAVMAVFGGWHSREEDPAEAVRAALAMQAWLKSRESAHGPALRMRIGIHTGIVVVGPADHSGEFLTGDAVNLASRLEHNAPVGGVLVSRETYSQVYGLFDAQPQPPLAVKGKSTPMETFVILRAKPRGLAMQMRGIEGVETGMIGRGRELKQLQRIFEQVILDRSAQLVMVVGDGGIGKSRLLREFQKWTDLLPDYFRLFCGRATLETATLPFSLIGDLFTARFEIQESDPVTVARNKFEQGMAGLWGVAAENLPALNHETLADIHLIGHLIGLDFSASPHLREIIGDADQIRQRAFHAFIRLFTGISQCPAREGFPAISAIRLVVEDLHWADEGSLDLLEHLARDCRGVPLMIASSARTEFFERHPNWCQGLPHVTVLNLEPLSLSESDAMLRTILNQVPEIPAALGELVLGGAEGNPFYIEEMIKMLMDQQVIVAQAEAWEIVPGRLLNTRVPSTLTGVLQARLDSLLPAERGVIQRASVVGRVFWDTAVAHMSGPAGQSSATNFERPLGEKEIASVLESLRRKGLLFRREPSAFAGAAEYSFKHELLRSVAYESLLKKTRRQHHARIAEWFTTGSAGRVHDFAGLVAAHFEHAVMPAEAARWHGRAGQQARLGYAPAIATRHFKKALQLLPAGDVPEAGLQRHQLEWHEGLAETLGAQARFSDALESCAAMLQLAQLLADTAAEARAWNGMAFLHERRGDNRASIQCAERAEALASSASDDGRAEKIRALHFKGWAFYRLGNAPEVLALGHQTLKLCTDYGNRRGVATSFKLLGVAHLQLGHFADADNFFRQGRELSEKLGDLRTSAAMWSNLGESARARGDFQTAVELYGQALALARQIGHRESELIYLSNLSGARLGLGQFAQAETDLRGIITQTLTPNTCTLAETYTFLSEACLGQKNFPEAIAAARKALDLARQSESSLDLGGAWRALGRAGAASPKSPVPAADAPAHCFAESLRIFRQMNAQGEQARTLHHWGAFELSQAQSDRGLSMLHEAQKIFLEHGALFEAGITANLLAQHSSG